MTTTVNFVAAVGRVSAGAISAKPKIEAICAKFGGRVTGGLGSTQDPIVAEFADKMAAAKAANEAFHLDDVEDARVVGADVGVVEGTKTEEEVDALNEDLSMGGMSGHDAHMEVHVRAGGDHELVHKAIKDAHAEHGVALSGEDGDTFTEHGQKDHPVDDYQHRSDEEKEKEKHTVIHVGGALFTDPDDTSHIHRIVKSIRQSPAAKHISAIKVTHDYIGDSSPMKKDAPEIPAHIKLGTEAIDAVMAGKTPAEVVDEMLKAPAAEAKTEAK